MSEREPLSPEARLAYEQWVSRQLNAQATHLFEHGLIDGRVQVAISWALPGRICIGTVASKSGARRGFWAISGDLPTDHLTLEQAATAREAARHFALKWQLQATRLAESQSEGLKKDDPKVWSDAAAELTRKAEALYAIAETDAHWAVTTVL